MKEERRKVEVGVKGERMGQEEYFSRRASSGVAKAKAFYELLVEAKVGAMKLEDTRRGVEFSDINIYLL